MNGSAGIPAILKSSRCAAAAVMILVFFLFVAVRIFTVIGILPQLFNQLTELIEQFPDMDARQLEAQAA